MSNPELMRGSGCLNGCLLSQGTAMRESEDASNGRAFADKAAPTDSLAVQVSM
jgi:hypothetical protein